MRRLSANDSQRELTAQNSNGWGLVDGVNHQLELWVNGELVIQGSTLPLNAWTYVAVTRTGGTWKIYKDGVPENATATQTPITPSDFYFGSDSWGAGFFSFKGLIADGAFYTHALSDARILAHFEAASTPAPSITLTASTTAVEVGSSVSLTAQLENTAAPSGVPIQFSLTGANAQQYVTSTGADGSAQFQYWPSRTGQDSATATATVGGTAISSSTVAVTASGIDCSGNPESLRNNWPGSTRGYYIRYFDGMSNLEIARHYRALGKALGEEIRTNPPPRVGSPAESCPSTIAVVLHFGAQTRLPSGGWGVLPKASALKRANSWVVNLAYAFGKGFFEGTGAYQQAYLRLVLGVNDNNGTLKRATDSRDWYLREDGTAIPQDEVTTHCTGGGDNIAPGTHRGITFVLCKDPITPAGCDVTSAPDPHFERMYCAGIAWGDVVESVNAKLRTIHALRQVAAAGGLDGEADFCSGQLKGVEDFRNTICGNAARSWVVGFGIRATRSLLVNYGDCAGCSAYEDSGADANTDRSWTWSMGDRFFVAAPPQGRARSLPQIYGDHQLDWLALARWGNKPARGSGQRKMIFVGR